MPREISGQQPISKSQKNKWRKKNKPVQVHGGTCSRCGQTSNSCTPGTVHETCGEATELFRFCQRINSSVIVNFFIGNKGKWLPQYHHNLLQNEMRDDKDQYLKQMRNFNTCMNRWENGYGTPINFHTREVLISGIKISVQMDVEPTAETERAAEKVAA